MFTDRFISRPVLAIALNILLLVAGLAALASLQIRQFPRMQFTVITVTTIYTGASADLVQGFVTQPMQEQIAAAGGGGGRRRLPDLGKPVGTVGHHSLYAPEL